MQTLKQVFYIIKQLLKAFLPGFFQSAVNLVSNVAGKPLHKKVKEHYLKHGWKWSKQNFGVIRNTDNPNTFNDIFYICTDDSIRLWWGTSEPGTGWTVADMNRLGVRWVGLIPLGFYEKLYKVGKMKKAGKCLRMQGQIMLYDVKKKRLRKGGGCHFHKQLKPGELVSTNSGGCQVMVDDKAHDEVMKIMGNGYIDYAISDIKEFPSTAGHKVG